MFEPVIHLVNN